MSGPGSKIYPIVNNLIVNNNTLVNNLSYLYLTYPVSTLDDAYSHTPSSVVFRELFHVSDATTGVLVKLCCATPTADGRGRSTEDWRVHVQDMESNTTGYHGNCFKAL